MVFCPQIPSLYPFSSYLFSRSGQLLFGLPNSLPLLFLPTCYHTIYTALQWLQSYIYMTLCPTMMLIGAGVDIWLKLVQATAHSPRNLKLRLKSNHLTDLLNGGTLGSRGDHIFFDLNW